MNYEVNKVNKYDFLYVKMKVSILIKIKHNMREPVCSGGCKVQRKRSEK